MKTKRFITMILVVAMVISSFGVTGNRSVKAATNGIVKGPNTVDAEDSFTTTLSSGEATTITVKNSVLNIKVSSTSYTFKIGNIVSITDQAVVNEKDGLLHILTLGGVYYCFDLYTGVQIIAYRNSSNGKYCSSQNAYAYMVYGKSLINNTYFYELLTSNSVVRELLITRAEFDRIVNGGDPSVDMSTPAPTAMPTAVPTTVPTAMPTAVPTAIPTAAPIVIPTAKPGDLTIEFNFEFWWKEYINGTITWDQFSQIMWKYHWTSTSETTSSSTTYYFYDADGKLIRTETIGKENTNASGVGEGSANVSTQGQATVKIETQGTGGATGTITVTATDKTTSTTKATSSKKFYFVRRHGQKVQLMRRYKGKTGAISTILYNKKKGTAKFNSHTFKGVKDCGYSQKSHQVVLLLKNGSIKILPTGKGKDAKKYIVRTYKGSYDSLQNNVNNLTIRATRNGQNSLGLKNAKPVSKF